MTTFPINKLQNMTICSKILSLVAVLVFFIAVTGLVGVYKMDRIGKELSDIAKRDMPATTALTNVTMHQLERAIAFERALRAAGVIGRDSRGAALRDRMRADFVALGQKVEAELVGAEALFRTAIRDSHSDAARRQFELLLDQFRDIRRGYASYSNSAFEAFRAIDQGRAADAERLADRAEVQQDAIDKRLEAVLQDIEAFTQAAVDTAETDEQSALMVMSIVSLTALISGITLGFVLARAITGPLGRTIAILDALSDGNTSVALKVDRDDELGILAEAVEVIRKKTIQAKTVEEKIRRMAMEDPLTGLPNRTEFHRRLQEAVDQADRTGLEFGVMLLDLDQFKQVNDTLGHPAGDDLLKQVTVRLLDCVRRTDTVARLGGDEFAIIATNLERADGVVVLGDRIVAAIAEPFDMEGHEIRTGASIGITVYPRDKGTPDELLRHADMALYRAKDDGRGTCQLYDEELNKTIQARRELENDLRHALARDEFHLVYQPQFSLQSGEIVGAEALLRWTHPLRGRVPPSDFIPVAESSRLIIPISDWLIRQVCTQIQSWRRQGLGDIRVAINLSMLHFKRQNLDQEIAAVLREAGLEAGQLELEITETMAMDGGDATKDILDRLKRLGVGLAIDDFGTGYSSLNRLKQFPVDKLKIDQSFVRDITEDPNDAAISSAVIRLGHSMNIQVIAEGVETRAHVDFLVEQGCDLAQGYYFCTPLTATEFAAFVGDHEAPAGGVRADGTTGASAASAVPAAPAVVSAVG